MAARSGANLKASALDCKPSPGRRQASRGRPLRRGKRAFAEPDERRAQAFLARLRSPFAPRRAPPGRPAARRAAVRERRAGRSIPPAAARARDAAPAQMRIHPVDDRRRQMLHLEAEAGLHPQHERRRLMGFFARILGLSRGSLFLRAAATAAVPAAQRPAMRSPTISAPAQEERSLAETRCATSGSSCCAR